MYHLRLIKGRSYCGIVSATQERPDAYTDNVDDYEAELATGYFEGLGVVAEAAETAEPVEFTDPLNGLIPAHMDAEQLEGLSLAELKEMAAGVGADTKGCKSKADYAKAIAAAEVYVAPYEEGSEPDFS